MVFPHVLSTILTPTNCGIFWGAHEHTRVHAVKVQMGVPIQTHVTVNLPPAEPSPAVTG